VSPAVLTQLVRGNVRNAVRGGLVWSGHEVLRTVDLFTRLAASVFVVRMISKLVGTWFFSPSAWEAAPQMLRGFDGAPPKMEPDQKPELLFTFGEHRFYRHVRQYAGQILPCPLLRVEPCSTCEFFVRGNDGKTYCAADAKIRTRYNDRFANMDLDDIREMLRTSYGSPQSTSATH